MLAKVIDITDQSVYLEVSNQLRFRSPYRLSKSIPAVRRNDRVDISFSPEDTRGVVIIAQVIGSRNAPGVETSSR